MDPLPIKQLGLVTPVLDDWEALAELLRNVAARFAGAGVTFHVVAVDDGSLVSAEPASLMPAEAGCIAGIDVVRLAANLGHQRAIAVGLTEIERRHDIDAVVVLDSDGEDRPQDIGHLLAAAEARPGHIVLAHRGRRSEALGFRLAYLAYKLLFRALTGRRISFGNFSLLPMQAVRRLVHMPELWNNLAVTIMRSRLPYVTVRTDRGRRYAGRSRMNVPALVVHGLSAMSVYADLIFVRILAAAAMMATASMLGIVGAATWRLATNMATPGWATTVVGNLLVLLLQIVVIVVAAALMLLSGRSNRQVIPALDARVFIAGVTVGGERIPTASPDSQ